MAYNTKIQLNLLKYENNTFKRIAVIDDYNEISFSRKMYEAGEFTITINQNIPNAKLFEIGTFVQFGSDKYDIGEINNITTPIGAEGKGSQNLVITGYDLRYLFKRRVIKNCNANGKWEMTAKGEIVMRSLIQDQCGTNAEAKRHLPIENVIPESEDAIGKEFSISESFSNLYDVLVTIATQSETGWRIRFEGGTMTLEFYEGEDLSASVFFSTEFDSLQDGEFNETTDAYSNTVYIGGKGQGDQRDIYEGEDGNPEGMDRFESWDDQSSLTNEIEYTNEALSMLAQYGDITTVQGTALAKNPYIYKENYNVGDIIKISFSGKSARTRVLSVTEHWSGRGQYAIDFEFGKPMNNLAGQLQLMLRQIQKAGNNSSSTDSVRWYTIPTDTEMPKADVTFNTIGFIGDCDNDGKTFKLYFDENGTGSKSYHVWFKQLAGSGKLTLTTGVEGSQSLELNSGTYVAIIYVDQQGNVLTQCSTPTNVIEAGNTQPATSNAVRAAIGAVVPVDIVEHGNMSAVTSNAVSISLSYSTEETLTGGTWIDGKPIYRKVISFQNETDIPNTGIRYSLSTLGLSNIDNIFNVYAINTTGSKTEKRRWSPISIFWRNESTIELRSTSSVTGYYLGLIIEYTKTTD
jgi:hypothetical protein